MYLKKSLGFSLVELMISLALGALVIAMISGLYVSGVVNNINGLKYARLKSDLQTIMHIMETDIRRAGLRGDAISVALGTASAANPFMWSEDIQVTRQSGSVSTVVTVSAGLATKVLAHNSIASSCIYFKYDADKSGGTPGANEHFGYRLHQGALQMTSNASDANPTTCTSGTWQPVTDVNAMKITKLEFLYDPVPTVSTHTRMRMVKINLGAAASIAGSTASEALSTTVQIRNLELLQ